MKKLLFLTIATLLTLPVGLSAQNPYILKKGDKKPTEYKKIELKNDKTYKVTYLKGGAGDVQINQAVYVWVPKPESVEMADTLLSSDPAKAAEAYLAAATEHKLFGWDPYCRMAAAKAFKSAKQYDKAINLFNIIRKEEFADPIYKKYPTDAALLLGETYLEAGQYAAALNFAKEQSKLKDDTLAGAAYLICGKIYRMQAKEAADNADKQKELLLKAAYAYFGAALLFKDSVTRPEALYTSWEILKELKDARANEFAKILREEYPNNEFTKRLQ